MQPPLVLIHGLADSPKVFDDFIIQVKAVQPDRLIIAPTIMFGAISTMIGSEDQYIRAIVSEMSKLRNQGILEIDLVAHSMGAFFARAYLQLYSH